MRTSRQSRNYNEVRIKTSVEKVQLSEKTFYQIMVFFRPESSACEAAYNRGGIFSRSLVFQAFSHVMVIIDEVSTLQRGPFANSGPHPAILLFDFPIIGPKKKLS